MHKPRKKIAAKADINITPLIDILLVLLVIFMTITPQIPKALVGDVPQPPRDVAQPPNPPDLIIVSVEKDNVVKINKEQVEIAVLGARLKEFFAPRADHTMFINADPDLNFEEVIKVIDIAKGNGAEKIGLMTQRLH